MDEPLVSIIIPTYNRKEKLVNLIESIFQNDYPKEKIEIIVVDDASTDNTKEYVNKMFPQVKVIRNNEEKLLAESRNIGIRASKGKYLLIIDDDNVIDKNTIKELVNYMEKHPQTGVAGPIMYFLSDPKRIWCAGVKRNYWTTMTKLIGFNTIDNGQYKEPYPTEDFPNAFMIRTEVIEKVGLFNSKLFPIHYDEADFCNRARRAKYQVKVVPSAKIWHDIPLPQTSRALTLHLKSPLRAYYATRNRIIFHWIWSKNIIQRFIALLFSIGITIYYIVSVLKDSNVRMKKELIVYSLKGVYGSIKMIKRKVKL